MYTKLLECPSTLLRTELKNIGVPSSEINNKTRNDCIRHLQNHGVYFLEYTKHNVANRQTYEDVQYKLPNDDYITSLPVSRNIVDKSIERNVIDTIVSNYQQEGQTTSSIFKEGSAQLRDARFSNLTITRNIHVNDKLVVNNKDISAELINILNLKDTLSNDIINLQVQIDKLTNDFQIAQNINLTIYNIANEISYNITMNSLKPNNLIYNLLDSSFYGKIEDTTVNIEMNVGVEMKKTYEDNDFILKIKLPFVADSYIRYIPATIILGQNYNEVTKEISSLNTYSVGFIDSHDPSYLNVRSTSFFKQDHAKYKINISMRYFGLLGQNIISPTRFSELNTSQYDVDTDEHTSTIDYQWSVLGKRVELIGNVFIRPKTKIRKLSVDLPLSADETENMEIVGTCIVYSSYWSTFPLIFISEHTRNLLTISYISGFNANTDYILAFHIVYLRSMNDIIYNLRFDKRFAKRGEEINVLWETSNNVNGYYFDNTLTLSVPWNITPDDYSKVKGAKKNWYMPIVIPTDSSSGDINVSIDLFDVVYNTSIPCVIDMSPPTNLTIQVSRNTTNPHHELSVVISNLIDDSTVNHNIYVTAMRKSGYGTNTIIDANIHISEYNINSPPFEFVIDELKDGIFYEISALCVDDLDQTATFAYPSLVQTLESLGPTTYDVILFDTITIPDTFFDIIQTENEYTSVQQGDDYSHTYRLTSYINTINNATIYAFNTESIMSIDESIQFIHSNIQYFLDTPVIVGSNSSYYNTNNYDSFIFVKNYEQSTYSNNNLIQVGDLFQGIKINNILINNDIDVNDLSNLTKFEFDGNVQDISNNFNGNVQHLIEDTLLDFVQNKDFLVTNYISSQTPYANITFPSNVFTGNVLQSLADTNSFNFTETKKLNQYHVNILAKNDVSNDFTLHTKVVRLNKVVDVEFNNGVRYIQNLNNFEFVVVTQFDHNNTIFAKLLFNDVSIPFTYLVSKSSGKFAYFTFENEEDIQQPQGSFKFFASTYYNTDSIEIVYDASGDVNYNVNMNSINFDTIQVNLNELTSNTKNRYSLFAHVYNVSKSVQDQAYNQEENKMYLELKYDTINNVDYLQTGDEQAFFNTSIFNDMQNIQFRVQNLDHTSQYMIICELVDFFNRRSTLLPKFVYTKHLPVVNIISTQQKGEYIHFVASIPNDVTINGNINWFYCIKSDESDTNYFTNIVKSPTQSLSIKQTKYMDTNLDVLSSNISYIDVYFKFNDQSNREFTITSTTTTMHIQGILNNKINVDTPYVDMSSSLQFSFQVLNEPITSNIENVYIKSVSLDDNSELFKSITTYDVNSNSLIISALDENMDELPSGYLQLIIEANINGEIIITESNVYDILLDKEPVTDITSNTTLEENGEIYLHITDIIDDTPIPKQCIIVSLANVNDIIYNEEILTPYPSIITQSNVESNITTPTFQIYSINWDVDFINNIVPQLTFLTSQSVNGIYYRETTIFINDVIQFYVQDKPLYQGTITETNEIIKQYELLQSVTITFSSNGRYVFHSSDSLSNMIIVINVIDTTNREFDFRNISWKQTDPFVTVPITQFDINYDIFQIKMIDKLQREVIFYHPNVIIGRMKTSDISQQLDVNTNILRLEFKVINFISIPTYGEYNVTHNVYGVQTNGNKTTSLQTKTSIYNNNNNETIDLSVIHAYDSYAVESTIIKGVSSSIHSVGVVNVQLNQSEMYDGIHTFDTLVDTSNAMITAATGLYMVAVISLRTSLFNLGFFDQLHNMLYKLISKTNDIQLVEDKIKILSNTQLNVVSNNTEYLDISVTCDIESSYMQVYGDTTIGIMVLKFNDAYDTSNPSLLEHNLHSLLFTSNDSHTQIPLDATEYSSTNLFNVKYFTSNNEIKSSLTSLNGTIMTRSQVDTVFNTISTNPSVYL